MDVHGGGFGPRLRAWREAAGLSQQELAERSGLSVRAVSNIERGRTQWPYRDSLSRLADALGMGEAGRAELLAAVPRRQLARPTQDAGSGIGASSAAHRSHAPQAPRQLPAAVGCFTGRTAELAALTGLLDGRYAAAAHAMVVSAVGGTAGVGKTALAIEWAQQMAGRFPDGQLYVNLRGYDHDQPVAAGEALAGLLRALGVLGHDIPDRAEERSALYRSRLAGRRMLVLLDNARDADQVRPLLPGDQGCIALVTSRDALAGLVAIDGARRLDLDVLPLADAVELLRSLIGPRARQDPGAVAELAGLCARLPLALRIAAELVASRPSAALAELVTELAERRLDCLDAGEDRADVRAVLSWSFRQLPGDLARTLALAGLHPGADLDSYAAAALTVTTAGQSRWALAQLRRASLLHTAGRGRYGMHDLLRAYAREQAAAVDPGGECDQALTRLFDYYLATAARAMSILVPAEAHRRRHTVPVAAITPDLASEADARAWLDTERANLVAVVVHCAEHGWPGHATGLAATLFRYLMNGSHLPEAQTIYSCALQAARQSGDLAAEAEAVNGLGGIDMMKGRFRDAAGHYRTVLEHYRRCSEPEGQARALLNLGITELQLHNFRSAAGYYSEALAAFDDAGDSLGAARTRTYLAAAETELGSYDRAADHLLLALPVLREARDEIREAETLEGIGELSLRRGQLAQAATYFRQALVIFRRIDHRTGVAAGLRNLSNVSLREGECQQAVDYARQALAQYRETGNQFGETVALRTLAEALHGVGKPAAARAELSEALRLADQTGNTYELASAHRDLAESHYRAGEAVQALAHWQQALTMYTQLGVPEADQVRSRLSALDAGQAEPPAGPPASSPVTQPAVSRRTA